MTPTGGGVINPVKVGLFQTVPEPEKPTKEGYTFVGWYLGDEKYDFSKPVISNITLVAKWNINKLSIKFDSNGGSKIESKQINYGSTISLPSIEREGYDFLGWTLDGVIITEETQIKKDITLKALWGADRNEVGEYVVLNAIQNIKYKSLLSAVNESKENDTIILLLDYETPNLGNWIEYNFADGCVFDLNGKTLTNNVNIPGTTPAGADSQSVYQGKNIVVQNGTIKGNGNYSFFIGNESLETSFTLKNIKTIKSGINCYSAKVTLKEGNYFDASESTYYAVYGDEATQIVIEDGEYIGGTNGISIYQYTMDGNTTEIKGGKFSGKINISSRSITGGIFSDDPSSYVPEGYTATLNADGTYTVIKDN